MSDKIFRKDPDCGILPRIHDETPPEYMRIKTDGFAEAKKYSYSREGSVFEFKRAYPIGDGDFGASVHGFPDNYTYNIGKNDLWWDDYDSDPACFLPGGIEEIRRRVIEGDADLKKDIFVASNNRNSQPSQTSAARLTLHLCRAAVFANVREKLDMSRGVIDYSFNCGNQSGMVCGTDFHVRSCISHSDEILYIHCAPSQRAGYMGKISFELTKEPMEVSSNVGALSEERRKELTDEIEKFYTPVPFVDGEFYGFDMRLKSGKDFEDSPDRHYTVMMSSSYKGFRAYCCGTRLIVEGRPDTPDVTLLLTVVSTYDAADTRTEAKKRLSRAEKHEMSTLIGNNCEWNQRIWKRSWVRLPEERMNRAWYWGLYQAMAARRPGKFAPGYLAPWHSSAYVNWGHHILTYEQAKSNLGLLSSNHTELLEPWFSLLKNSREKLIAFTKSFYNMEGTAYPHSISGTGTVTPSSITLNGTEMNIHTGGESVKYCWDYYEYTGDIDFLREVGYPILKDAAIFYDEYLLTADDGERYIFPSRSLEYCNPVGFADEFMTNSVFDLCMFKNTLSKAAEAADILGVDKELSDRWKEDLKQMRSDYPTWPDGSWKISEDCKDKSAFGVVECLAVLAPVSYTGEVDKWHGESKELMASAEKSVNRLVPPDSIPWDRSFSIIARLRMGDKKFAAKMCELIPEEYEIGGNLESTEPDGWDFAVNKAAASTTEVINEMLLQSQGGTIRIFPAWDEKIGDASFGSLRASGAFLVSAEMRAGKAAYAIVKSLAGNKCRFANPFGEKVRVRDLDTEETVDFDLVGDDMVFTTKPDHEYVVENEEAPLESFEIVS